MRILPLLAIAAFTMGAEGCNESTRQVNTCAYFHYPPCGEVQSTYDCPCISYPDGWDPETVAEVDTFHGVYMEPNNG